MADTDIAKAAGVSEGVGVGVGVNSKQQSTFLSNGRIDHGQHAFETAAQGSDVDHEISKTVGAAPDNDIPLLCRPAYSVPRKLRVITIGAGFSSLIFAHKIRYEHPEVEDLVTNTIYEARPEVGGTWLVNSYPGVQCDVPSHIYAFPFDPNPEWSHFYSTGPQIQEYITKTVRKWDLDRDIKLNTRVVGTYWQEDLAQWKVVVENDGKQREDFADVLISAQGFLNTWKWPEILGLQEFEGHKVHSASWDHGYDYSEKKIAVIGNGSSGIQILPALAKLDSADITAFQRGPTWIVARMDPGKLLGKPNIGPNPQYTEDDKRRFREDKEHHHQYRKNLIHRINTAFRMVSLCVVCGLPT